MWIFEPILKTTLWGGERISAFKGVDFTQKSIGESWEISGIKGKESIVVGSADNGMILSELLNKYKADLLGKANYARFKNEFPLLVKFIDAQKDLSIQVHPNNEMAQRLCNCQGKSEMWYVIDAAPSSVLCNGFSEKVSREEYEQRVADGSIAQKLHYNTDIKKGDLFYVPAGRVHSIGAGAFLLEIQQTSDITYRIYDFGRLDSNGNHRELHTKYALEALNFDDNAGSCIDYERKDNCKVQLLETTYFTTNLFNLDIAFDRDYSGLDTFKILIVVEGECEISNSTEKLNLRQGMTVLIPASDRSIKIVPKNSVSIVETYVE